MIIFGCFYGFNACANYLIISLINIDYCYSGLYISLFYLIILLFIPIFTIFINKYNKRRLILIISNISFIISLILLNFFILIPFIFMTIFYSSFIGVIFSCVTFFVNVEELSIAFAIIPSCAAFSSFIFPLILAILLIH